MQCGHTFFEIFAFLIHRFFASVENARSNYFTFLLSLRILTYVFFCLVLFKKSPCARSAITLHQYIEYIFVKILEISQKRYAVLSHYQPYSFSCWLNNSFTISFEYFTQILIKCKKRKNDDILHKFKRHCTMQKLFLFVFVYIFGRNY